MWTSVGSSCWLISGSTWSSQIRLWWPEINVNSQAAPRALWEKPCYRQHCSHLLTTFLEWGFQHVCFFNSALSACCWCGLWPSQQLPDVVSTTGRGHDLGAWADMAPAQCEPLGCASSPCFRKAPNEPFRVGGWTW